jgi:hypothetical protein
VYDFAAVIKDSKNVKEKMMEKGGKSSNDHYQLC